MSSSIDSKDLIRKIFEEHFESTLDKLPPEKREIIEHAASSILTYVCRHLSNYSIYIVRRLEDRGLKVNLNYDLRKTRRGVVISIMFELKDIDPTRVIEYYRYYSKKAGVERWAKWTFLRLMREMSEELMEEAMEEYLDKGEPEIIVESKSENQDKENVDSSQNN